MARRMASSTTQEPCVLYLVYSIQFLDQLVSVGHSVGSSPSHLLANGHVSAPCSRSFNIQKPKICLFVENAVHRAT